MPYNPAEPTPLDVIRGIAGDTSEDELLEDATYLAVMARYGAGSEVGDPTDTAPFYRSAAEIIRRVATIIERQPTSVSEPRDGSVGWTAFKSKALLLKADELERLADAIDAGGESGVGKVVTVFAPYMAGDWDEPWQS